MYGWSKETSLLVKIFVQDLLKPMRMSDIPDQLQQPRNLAVTFSMEDLLCNERLSLMAMAIIA